MTMSLAGSHDDLQKALDDLATEHRIPGASIAVLAGDETLHLATGVLSQRTSAPTRLDSLFLIGSISKVWTATLVMQLVDEGLVELDASVRTYLPELRLATPEDTEALTVRHLLSHTAGTDEDFMIPWGDRGDGAVARYAARAAELGQLHPPGALYSYCNTGMVVAGLLVEHFRRMPYDVAVTRLLGEPLGLTDTCTFPEDVVLRSAAVGHVPDGAGGLRPVDAYSLPRAFGPAGATIAASAGDLLTFARMHLDDGVAAGGDRVLSASSVLEMQSPQVLTAGSSGPGEGACGLGWHMLDQGGLRLLYHGGGNIGQNCGIVVVPERRVAVCVLTNSLLGAPFHQAVYREILRRTTELEDFASPSTPPAAAEPIVVEDPDRYVGVYRQRTREIVVARDGDGLTCSAWETSEVYRWYGVSALDERPPARPIVPVSEWVFVLGGENLYGRQGEKVVFVDLDGDGRPEYVYVGISAARREDA